MKKFSKILLAMAFVIGTFIAFMNPVAHATLISIRLDDPIDPGAPIIITDALPGDLNPLPGVVTYIGPVGPTWVGNVTTGQTVTGQVYIHFDSVDTTSVGTGPYVLDLWVTLQDCNLGNSVPLYSFRTTGSFTIHASTGAASVTKYFDSGNLAFGTGTTVHSWATPDPYSGGIAIPTMTSFVTSQATDFSITDYVQLTHYHAGSPPPPSATSSFDIDNTVTPIPEPGTLLLLGSGLVGLAGYAKVRLKRRRS